MNIIPHIVATGLALASVIGLLINFIVLYAIVRGRLLFKRQSSSVYILSASSIVMEIFMILVHLAYLVPAIYTQSWLFDGGMHSAGVRGFSFAFLYCWYYTTLSHILISTTRLYSVVRWSSSLTNGTVLALVILTHLLSLAGAVCTDVLFPCCKIYLNYMIYTYFSDHITGIFNYSEYIIELPVNASSSACSFVCYTVIILYMRWVSREVTGEIGYKRRHQEYVYAMQFAAMAAFYTISWLTFRIFPPIVQRAPHLDWLYGITTLFVLFNSWSNAFVYLVNNAEIKRVLRRTAKKVLQTSSARAIEGQNASSVQ
ncbi:hypothetical protein PRIPAC_80343 [Pristionchus pacificus]|uniref:G_PROTEIN_RECEP_F1_2 domain-containing protein n=1 Tax=Pristionchus pacificus TaxID=54126 RepID=A0A2A6CQ92_PRIPA|nr:hypothetical protein PRIPAC_80343 [Pristionchus pacificus]|eukprot:PDM80290.1 hypothetical protein PRIPAC_32869 [Pristionchus pacificus]